MTLASPTTEPSGPSAAAVFLSDRTNQAINDRWKLLDKVYKAEARGQPAKVALLAVCKDDTIFWINNFCFTFDPRLASDGINPNQPFVLFPKQEEFIRWLVKYESSPKNVHLLCVKCRDVGVTWMAAAYAVHHWLFVPGFRTGFGSRKLELVDTISDPKSIFEKIRYIIRNLPTWMLPAGWDEVTCMKHCNVRNPANENTISGEGGDDIGRGDRTTIYFVDEAASLVHPQLTDASLSQTTRIRCDLSTPRGTSNPFYAAYCALPVEQRFEFEWWDDPRKNQQWYDDEKKRITDPYVFAQEVDKSFAGSEAVEWPKEYFEDIPGHPLWFEGDFPKDIIARVVACDPSKGKGEGNKDKPGDFSAILDIGVDRAGTLWVDADIDQQRPVEPPPEDPNVRSIAGDCVKMWRSAQFDAMVVEVNGFQEWVAVAIVRLAKALGLRVMLWALNSRMNKEARIRTLSPYFSQRRFRVRKSRGGQILVQQLREFPKGAHDDGADSLKAGERILDKLLNGDAAAEGDEVKPYRT